MIVHSFFCLVLFVSFFFSFHWKKSSAVSNRFRLHQWDFKMESCTAFHINWSWLNDTCVRCVEENYLKPHWTRQLNLSVCSFIHVFSCVFAVTRYCTRNGPRQAKILHWTNAGSIEHKSVFDKLSTITIVSIILSWRWCCCYYYLHRLPIHQVEEELFQYTLHSFNGLNSIHFWHTNFPHHFRIATLNFYGFDLNKQAWKMLFENEFNVLLLFDLIAI